MMTRALAVAILLALTMSVGWAADNEPAQLTVALIKLKYLDAQQAAWMFGGSQPMPPPRRDPEAARRELADSLRSAALEVAKPNPEAMRDAGVYVFPLLAVYQVEAPPVGYQQLDSKPVRTVGGFAALLPEGITGPPAASVDDNSLVVRGSAEAIDEFREIVALLDRKPKRVSLSVGRLIVPASTEPGLRAIDVLPRVNGSAELARDPLPSLAVDSNRFALVRLALAAPFVAVTGGGAPGDYRVGAALDVRDLMVMPRANADDSISLFISPADGPAWEAIMATPPDPKAGAPSMPTGTVLVRVANGGTAILAGLPQAADLLAREPGLRHVLPGASPDSQNLLLITARVLPDDEAHAALPAK